MREQQSKRANQYQELLCLSVAVLTKRTRGCYCIIDLSMVCNVSGFLLNVTYFWRWLNPLAMSSPVPNASILTRILRISPCRLALFPIPPSATLDRRINTKIKEGHKVKRAIQVKGVIEEEN